MPHHESPPRPQIVVSKASTGNPPQEDVQSLFATIFTSKTSQASLDASYALTDLLLNTTGFHGLAAYSVIEEALTNATNKKDGGRREGAMFLVGAMFEKMIAKEPASEVVFLQQYPDLLPTTFDSLSDKGSAIREGAQYAIDALYSSLRPESLVVALLPLLITYIGKPSGKWQGKVGAFEMIGKIANKTKTGGLEMDVLREAMGKRLDRMIPPVEAGMHDLKNEVGKAALKTMNALTVLLQNDDVEPRIPLLIKSMQDPSKEALQKAIHALSQTTFVAVVTSPVLALLTPILERSLNNPTTSQEVLRQTVIVVENLTKLVHDPVEARAFLPKLRPGVQAVQERAALPEVREIATRALATISKAMRDDNSSNTSSDHIARTRPEDVAARLSNAMSTQGIDTKSVADPQTWSLLLSHMAEMVAEDVDQRAIPRITNCTEPYLKNLVTDPQAAAVAAALVSFYDEEDKRKHGAPVKDDDGEVEIVNADFSLGYGGMLLLTRTNLRLLKGHRYGLCGRNGAGKSTLMRSIADDKLEGFPPPDEVRSCFVEHNQGEDADLSILEYVSRDPRFAGESKSRISSVLEEVGFDAGPNGRQSQKVGSLSGGWKMKLALARAMLMKADVLLLDEPTNHLDVANVKWLEEYLKAHTEITSLIVSHDSGFLDEVCTDIYHYESKKLVHYRGNLSEFVKQKPEAKSYYTLSATNAQFKFPPPGILPGIKSMTKAILRMSNCTFTYPGQSSPSLMDVSCQLSLSSRIAVIGPNGAGKSTLIKVLTGEVVPQKGTVEKHPNLRIGYIKQHALEHVEMHMEKTPNQYLQWRYANGDDREVFLKQTRVLSDEEKEQMAKFIKLGPGVEGHIEALIGRQKYKKSYQYEVKWVNKLPKHNTMVSRETLEDLGFAKLVQEFDDHEASREGLGYRILEPKIISKHFEDIGLDPEIANHNQISGLSGGQKVKVVLAGAMWNNPHMLILDEPTNFLDRDALGGLAVAIRDFRGAVAMISHNEEFVGALCPEQWHVRDGRLESKGHLAVALDRFEDSGSATPMSSKAGSTNASASASAVNSEAEEKGELKFKAKKKKKVTRAQMKEREVRRRLRHIEWLNSPKGTPHPKDTDDEDE